MINTSVFIFTQVPTNMISKLDRLLKNAHLRRSPHPSSLQRTFKYASADSPTRRRGKKSLLIRRDATLRISGALHLNIFAQPEKILFFSTS
jgi:hypothetical protein